MNVRYGRIAVKIGSNVLTKADKMLDVARMASIVEQISRLRRQGVQVILVSSGAVAAGRSEMRQPKKLDDVSSRQLFSAIGQVRLINRYYDLFRESGITCAQVLATKECFKDRRHYLNMKNCITTLLDNDVIPIINENDTISITELMFTDNDELSGLIASMMNTEALVILSNVDGIFTGNPQEVGTTLIHEVESHLRLSDYISEAKSEFGRGGMITKSTIAKKVAKEGIHVHIANGKRDNVLFDLMDCSKAIPNTHFVPSKKEASTIKKWLAHSESFAKGKVVVNEGAALALKSSKASSLLLIGIESVDGYFKQGDLVLIYDINGNEIGLGKSQYDSEKSQSFKGSRRSKPFIHYDYLLVR